MFNKRLIEIGVPIHCKSKEEIDEVLKEMNWEYRKSFMENVKDNNWDVYIFSCDYDSDGWSAEFDGDGFTQKLEFEDLKKSPIALYLGVEENKEFKMRYNGHENHMVILKFKKGEEITISGEYYFEDFKDGEEYILEDIIKDDEIYFDAR